MIMSDGLQTWTEFCTDQILILRVCGVHGISEHMIVTQSPFVESLFSAELIESCQARITIVVGRHCMGNEVCRRKINY